MLVDAAKLTLNLLVLLAVHSTPPLWLMPFPSPTTILDPNTMILGDFNALH